MCFGFGHFREIMFVLYLVHLFIQSFDCGFTFQQTFKLFFAHDSQLSETSSNKYYENEDLHFMRLAVSKTFI